MSNEVKEPYRWVPWEALLFMYFGGGAVWWLLSTALPWLGVPPLCITLLWLVSYYTAYWVARKLATRLDH